LVTDLQTIKHDVNHGYENIHLFSKTTLHLAAAAPTLFIQQPLFEGVAAALRKDIFKQNGVYWGFRKSPHRFGFDISAVLCHIRDSHSVFFVCST